MSFEMLQDHVKNGELDFIHISAAPRTMSTPLLRSLAEAGEISLQFNEPFNKNNGDMNDAANWLLLGSDQRSPVHTDSRALVVTKNLAHHMPPDAFEDWLATARDVVFAIRHPQYQLGSLVTRMANDLLFYKGANKLSQQDAMTYLPMVTSVLEDQNFKKAGWSALGDHYRARGVVGGEVVAVDAEALLASPEDVLRGACARLNLTYTQQMVNGWQGTLMHVNTDGYEDEVDEHWNFTSAWINVADATTGFIPNSRPPLLPEQMPFALRQYYEEVALPVYGEISSDNSINPLMPFETQ